MFLGGKRWWGAKPDALLKVYDLLNVNHNDWNHCKFNYGFASINRWIDFLDLWTGLTFTFQNCKTLLHYKRDELKKLWLDGVEHRHVLRLLEQM